MVRVSPVSRLQPPVAWSQVEEWEEAPLAQRERCKRTEPEESASTACIGMVGMELP